MANAMRAFAQWHSLVLLDYQDYLIKALSCVLMPTLGIEPVEANPENPKIL